jgi:hypothetical protein
MLLSTTATMSNTTASDYLKRVSLEEKPFSPQRMKMILAAAILRYLGGVIPIQFVIDLNNSLLTYKNITLDKDLVEITAVLSDLGHHVTDEKNMRENLRTLVDTLMQRN